MSKENDYHFIWYDIDEEDNVFGVKILDIRSYTQNITTTTNDKSIIDKFQQLTKSDGKVFSNLLPENHKTISCNLNYPCKGVTSGPVFISPEMDHKWNIYYHNSHFFFVRSWTGELIHRAHAEFKNNSLIIQSIDTTKNELRFTNDQLIVREVDFLIKTHLLKMLAPHPVSEEMITEEPIRTAISSFNLYGKKANYASAEDTTKFTFQQFVESMKKLHGKKPQY